MENTKNTKVFDLTLRDGGLVNDFHFSDEFVRSLFAANRSAGVDCMEFGYRADRKQFDPEKYGKWMFSSDEDIRKIVGENKGQMKISVMADVGRCDHMHDIGPKSDSPVDLFRIATYIDGIPEAIRMIEHINSLGYETTCNLMAVSSYDENALREALILLSKCPAMGVYIVDSYGALIPKDIRRLASLFTEILSPVGKATGIHAHNNQQCALANTLEALDNGASLLDGTVLGMGRGAGNCHLEALLGHLQGAYDMRPLLPFIREHMLPLAESGVTWGPNTSYLITGLQNRHPRSAIEATKKSDRDFLSQYDQI